MVYKIVVTLSTPTGDKELVLPFGNRRKQWYNAQFRMDTISQHDSNMIAIIVNKSFITFRSSFFVCYIAIREKQ